MSARPVNNPFAIQLEVEFLDRLSEPVREGRVRSVSDLIRTALERYDFDNVVVVRPAQLVISVRLPIEIRRKLKQLSKSKHTSIGQLVRAAVEAYLPQLEHEAAPGGIEMPIPHVELPEDPSEKKAVARTRTPARASAKTSAKRKAGSKKSGAKVRAGKARSQTDETLDRKAPPAGIAAARRKGMTRKRTQG